MPATGAIARTAVNVRSGAHTRLSAITHALAIFAVIYAATWTRLPAPVVQVRCLPAHGLGVPAQPREEPLGT